MNQFHTPSFGDEVFEMNETPLEQTQHPNAVSSRAWNWEPFAVGYCL